MRLAHPFVTSPSSTKRRKPGPWDADWERAQARFARIIQRALGRMGMNVWEKIQKEARRRKALPDVPDDPEFWAGEEAAFFGETSGGVNELLLEGVTQAEALGLGVDFELVNQQVLDYTRTYSNEWWSRMESTTREGLRTAIATNIETGAPLSSLRKSITPLFGARRAEMIASTEVTRLFAEGNKIVYLNAGVMELEWRSVMDERVCIDCDSRNGQRYPINDPKATPPLHTRCRCWIAPIVAGKPLTEPLTPWGTVHIGEPADHNRIIASLRGLDHERAVIVKGGRVTSIQEGTATRIDYLPKGNYRGATHYHNHPHKLAPSDGDVDFLLMSDGPDKMYVITPQGDYTLTRLKEGDFTTEVWKALNRTRMEMDDAKFVTALSRQEEAVRGAARITKAFSYSFSPVG